jgi:hypothetical protein
MRSQYELGWPAIHLIQEMFSVREECRIIVDDIVSIGRTQIGQLTALAGYIGQSVPVTPDGCGVGLACEQNCAVAAPTRRSALPRNFTGYLNRAVSDVQGLQLGVCEKTNGPPVG